MRVCVVGNGFSAKGHGDEIDACDFVVRIKAWWKHGAIDAGQRVDVTAWFGTNQVDWKERGPDGFKHWRTWSDRQYVRNGRQWRVPKLFFERFARGRITNRLSWKLQVKVKRSTLNDPSTGIIAIAMAVETLKPSELLLYGFDGTIMKRPHYHDARPPKKGRGNPHNQLREKRVIAGLLNGRWLGEPSSVKLIWPDMPELK